MAFCISFVINSSHRRPWRRSATALANKYATMHVLNTFLEPGELVVNPAQPDWGIGQVQSIAANLITVNFENAGKVVLDGTQVVLEASTDAATRP